MFTKEEKDKWYKLQEQNKSSNGKGYVIVLWIILSLSFISGISTSAIAKSAIHEIYASISFLIATIVFCTLAIISKIDNKR